MGIIGCGVCIFKCRFKKKFESKKLKFELVIFVVGWCRSGVLFVYKCIILCLSLEKLNNLSFLRNRD